MGVVNTSEVCEMVDQFSILICVGLILIYLYNCMLFVRSYVSELCKWAHQLKYYVHVVVELWQQTRFLSVVRIYWGVIFASLFMLYVSRNSSFEMVSYYINQGRKYALHFINMCSGCFSWPAVIDHGIVDGSYWSKKLFLYSFSFFNWSAKISVSVIKLMSFMTHFEWSLMLAFSFHEEFNFSDCSRWT